MASIQSCTATSKLEAVFSFFMKVAQMKICWISILTLRIFSNKISMIFLNKVYQTNLFFNYCGVLSKRANVTYERPLISVFDNLIQCLHHISVFGAAFVVRALNGVGTIFVRLSSILWTTLFSSGPSSSSYSPPHSHSVSRISTSRSNH